MQVDTGQLRTAAAKIRDDMATRLKKAADWQFPEAGFDQYTSEAPCQEATTAWVGEVQIIQAAALELADALDKAAAAYDKADADAAKRLKAPR
jgi:hypothetical protein